MKQSQITLIVIGFILVALMATNPSTEEHKDAIKKEIFKAIESDNNSNSAQQLGEKIGESIGGALIDNMVERQNYILFSLTTIKIVKQQDDVTNNTITLGIFGQIILLKKYDKESKEFVDNIGFNGAESYVTTDKAAFANETIDNNKTTAVPLSSDLDVENNFKIYTISKYQVKHKIGAKLDWSKVFEIANNLEENNFNSLSLPTIEENNFNSWRLPSIEELKEIYPFRYSLGITNGEFWSSTLHPPHRMGLISCIDFSNGDASILYNEGQHYYLLIKTIK
jgi:hypothetical protein